MSRSRKKPWLTNSYKYDKKVASKKVRNTKEVYQNGNYKKLYESWNICDWRIYDPDEAKYYRK